jgi:hypothetical protein
MNEYGSIVILQHIQGHIFCVKNCLVFIKGFSAYTAVRLCQRLSYARGQSNVAAIRLT